MDYTDINGKTHRFPDGTSQAVVEKAMGPLYVKPKESGDDFASILNNLTNEGKSISDTLANPGHIIKAGLMGLGEGGQNIASAFTSGRSPRVNMNEVFGIKDPNIIERAAAGIGQYAPLLAAGPMGLIPDTIAGAGYGATQSPEDITLGAGVGAGSNATFNLLGKMIQNRNPWIKTAAKALFGGGAGYALNGDQGAAEGAVGMTLGHKLLKKAGVMGNPAEEIMSRISPEEVRTRAEAGLRLKTPLSPGEAAARPDITGVEAGIGQTGEAAPERVKIGQQRIADQKAAIEDLGKTITSSTKIASFDVRKAAQDSIKKMEDARQEAVEPFYKKAHENQVDPHLIAQLEQSDPTIKAAINDAIADPKYQVEGELLGVPKNSIKTLDYAKRNIDAKINQAMKAGDRDAVRVLTKSKNKLLDKMDSFSGDYKQARSVYSELSKPIEEVENSQIGQIARMKDTQLKNVSKNIFDPSQTDPGVLRQVKDHIMKQNPEAWDTIVKNELDRLMTQGKNNGITGRSFFDRVLSNDNRFKQFQAALEHNPEASQQLNDMKLAWEHLINLETPRTAAGAAKAHVNMWRSSVEAIVGMYNNLMGGKNQIKALRYLYGEKWPNDVGKIKLMPKKDQKPMMSLLLGKTIAPAYVLDDKGK